MHDRLAENICQPSANLPEIQRTRKQVPYYVLNHRPSTRKKSVNEHCGQRKIGDPVTEVPYHINTIHKNSAMNINRGTVIENISNRRIKPYPTKVPSQVFNVRKKACLNKLLPLRFISQSKT